METRAKIRFVYDSKTSTDGDKLVDVTTTEDVVVRCSPLAVATTDHELYHQLLKTAVPELRGDKDHIWSIDILNSNVPEFCFEYGLDIHCEEPVFCFECRDRGVFENYLANQLGISSKVGPFNPVHICDDCLSAADHCDSLSKTIH